MIRIDAGQEAEIMKQMNLPAIPVFILYKNGKEVFRKNGIVAQSDFETAIQPNLLYHKIIQKKSRIINTDDPAF
jgi:thioredoxin-like negative regulator of GroEL